MTSIRRLLPIILLVLLTAASRSAQKLDEAGLSQLAWRAIGPAVMGGRIDDVAVDERNPSTIYVGAASGGVWKTTNHGTTWTPLFDRPGRGLDWRHRAGALATRPRLGRHRRAEQPPELQLRRRHLQVHGRRPHLDPHGPSRHAAHRPRHHRPGRSRDRLCRSARTALGPEHRARRVQDHRWRPHLDQREVHRPGHRLRGHGDGSGESPGALRRGLSAAPRAVGLQRRRARRRHLQDRGRRAHVDKADERPAHRHDRPHRSGHLAEGSARALRHRRAPDRGRHVSIGRWRRDVAEDEQRQPEADVLQQDPHRPDQRSANLRAGRLVLRLERRRADVRGSRHGPRRARTTR